MRVSDRNISQTFLLNFSDLRSELGKVQKKVITQKEINKPSDSPLASAKIISFNERLQSINTYKSNVQNASSFTSHAINALEGVEDMMQKMMVDLVNINNPTNSSALEHYQKKFENYLNTLTDLSNAEYDGMYLFGGTSSMSKPFSINSEGTEFQINSNSLEGNLEIKTSRSISQKINISGREFLGNSILQKGSLDSNLDPADTVTSQKKILDGDGKELTVSMEYNKVNNHEFQVDLRILDKDGNEVFASQDNDIVFDSATGKIQSLNGNTHTQTLNINLGSEKINFAVDLSSLTESTTPKGLKLSSSMEGNIFDTLISIKENLKSGVYPNENQVKLLNSFHKQVLVNLSELGTVQNNLTAVDDLLTREETELTELLSKENDVDMAKYAIELQNRQYALDVSYKISSMILPKSILDYL